MKNSALRDLGRRAQSRQGRHTRRRSRNEAPAKWSRFTGKVTAINAGPPPTVTVAGKQMRYPTGYVPTLDDQVIYFGGRDPHVAFEVAS